MAVPERRIVLLGKSGVGKSELANTICGEKLFKVSGSSNSVTSECQSKTRDVHGKKVTMIDTPGFFDTNNCEDDLKFEMTQCGTLSAPGVHAFVIVLRVERFTQQEKEVISKIKESFSKEALKYAVIVFTHGDQLKDQKIEDFVKENHDLRGLVEECGGRCHVVDNRYWNKERNNEEVKKLLNTIDKMVEQNNGDMYTNEMLEQVHILVEKVADLIGVSSKNMSVEEIKKEAQKIVSHIIKKAAGISTGVLLGALLGVPMMVGRALRLFKLLANYLEEFELKTVKDASGDMIKISAKDVLKGVAEVAGAYSIRNVPRLISGSKTSAAATGFFAVAGISCVIGAVEGAVTGYNEAGEAASPGDAAKKTARAVCEATIAPFKELCQTKEQKKNT